MLLNYLLSKQIYYLPTFIFVFTTTNFSDLLVLEADLTMFEIEAWIYRLYTNSGNGAFRWERRDKGTSSPSSSPS